MASTSTRPLPPSDRPTRVGEASTGPELAADHEIDGRYRIEELLGTGAMGAVYRGRHVEVGRRVAIKVLAPEWSRHATMPERFREEARAASAIGHPNIVSVIDAGSLPDGRPYLVMELLEGRLLSAAIRDEAPLEPQRALALLTEIARAISAAHQAGIVHRDLKPENVMLLATPDGERVKVLDFGIAHAVAPLRARLTVPGTVMGTPEYMAPEQVRGDEASPSFDIYALGVIGYEMLSGRVPIGGTTSVEIMARKSLDPSPSLAMARPDLPAELVALVDACLAREPEDRPASARALIDSFERLRRGAVAASPPATRRGRSGARAYAVAAGVVFVGALAWGTARRDAASPVPSTASSPALDRVRVMASDEGVRAPSAVSPSSARPAPGREPGPEAITPALDGADSPVPETSAGAATDGDVDAAREPLGVAPTASCGTARRGAEAARRDQKWTRLLRWLDARGCFPAAERIRLRTKAYMELGRFDRCVAAGRGSGDSEVQRMVRLCRDRG